MNFEPGSGRRLDRILWNENPPVSSSFSQYADSTYPGRLQPLFHSLRKLRLRSPVAPHRAPGFGRTPLVRAVIGTAGAVCYCGSLEEKLPTITVVGMLPAFYGLLLIAPQSDST